MSRYNWIYVVSRANMYIPKGKQNWRFKNMKNGFHEGTIGIPQKDGSSKIAHYWVKAYARKSEWGING